MKILVTGVAGQLGHDVMNELAGNVESYLRGVVKGRRIDKHTRAEYRIPLISLFFQVEHEQFTALV